MSLPGFTIEVEPAFAAGTMRLERRSDGLRLLVDSPDTIQALLLAMYEPVQPAGQPARHAA